MPGPSNSSQPVEFNIPVTTGEVSGQSGHSTVPERDVTINADIKPPASPAPAEANPQVTAPQSPAETGDQPLKDALGAIQTAASSGQEFREEAAAPIPIQVETTPSTEAMVKDHDHGGLEELLATRNVLPAPEAANSGVDEPPAAEVLEEPPSTPVVADAPVIATAPPAEPEALTTEPPAISVEPPLPGSGDGIDEVHPTPAPLQGSQANAPEQAEVGLPDASGLPEETPPDQAQVVGAETPKLTDQEIDALDIDSLEAKIDEQLDKLRLIREKYQLIIEQSKTSPETMLRPTILIMSEIREENAYFNRLWDAREKKLLELLTKNNVEAGNAAGGNA